jgi:hypothetical protein
LKLETSFSTNKVGTILLNFPPQPLEPSSDDVFTLSFCQYYRVQRRNYVIHDSSSLPKNIISRAQHGRTRSRRILLAIRREKDYNYNHAWAVNNNERGFF